MQGNPNPASQNIVRCYLGCGREAVYTCRELHGEPTILICPPCRETIEAEAPREFAFGLSRPRPLKEAHP